MNHRTLRFVNTWAAGERPLGIRRRSRRCRIPAERLKGGPVTETVTLPEPARTIDTSGKLCPYPIVEAARAVKGIDAGAVLCVISTDPGIQLDMPMWCKATRNEHLATVREGKVFRSFVRKGGR